MRFSPKKRPVSGRMTPSRTSDLRSAPRSNAGLSCKYGLGPQSPLLKLLANELRTIRVEDVDEAIYVAAVLVYDLVAQREYVKGHRFFPSNRWFCARAAARVQVPGARWRSAFRFRSAFHFDVSIRPLDLLWVEANVQESRHSRCVAHVLSSVYPAPEGYLG